MKIQKNRIIITIIALIILAIIGYAAYKNGYFNYKDTQTEEPASDGEKKYTEEEIKQYDQYMKDASAFILAGDKGDKDSYRKAIDLYEKAAAVGSDNVWVPFLNIGNLYRKLGEFDKSETAYNKALEISKNGTDEIYFQKIDLYRYDLKKSNEEVGKLYEEALDKVVYNANVILRYATFLRDTGQFEKALSYYETLVKNYPDNQAYKDEVAAIKAKLGK